MKPLCIYNVNAKINILWHPIPKTCVSQKIKVSYGIQFPKSCAIFFSPSSFWWCWWLGIWKQSTGKALTVLLNKLMLNSRQPTTKNLWSSKTVTLDVVFRKFTQISATLEWEPRQIFGAGSTGQKNKKTHDYIWYLYPIGFSFRLIQFARLSPHFYLSNIVCLKHHVVKTSYLHLHLNLQNSENIQFCVNFLKTSQWLPHDLSLDGYIIVNNKNPVILKIMSILSFSNINISKKQQC